MYKFVIPCGCIEFLNDEQFLYWAEKYGNCKKGCIDKICEQKEVCVNGFVIKVKDFNVEK